MRMGPISPPKEFPVAMKIIGGLNPERTIFIDGGVPKHTKWFDITLQCGPSLSETDDIAFRLLVAFFDDYASYLTNSSINGEWDDELARKYELKLKGLSNEPAFALNKAHVACSSTSCIELLRCAADKKHNYYKLKSTAECARLLDSASDDVFDNFSKPDQSREETQHIINPYQNQQPSNIILKHSAESTRLVTLNQDQKLPQSKSSNKLKISAKSSSRLNVDEVREIDVFDNFTKIDQTKEESQIINPDQIQQPTEIILKKSAESTRLVTSHQDQKLSQSKSSNHLNISAKSSLHLNADEGREIPLKHSISYENFKPSAQSTRFVFSDQNHSLQLSSEELSSHSLKTLRLIQSTISEAISIYIPTAPLKIAESIFIHPDPDLSDFETGKRTIKTLIDDNLDENFSDEELNEIEMSCGQPFSMALECLENGYLAFLNGDLFCVYPHHFSYERVTYIVFNGEVDLEQVEIGGGKGPDRTLVVDLYDEVIWSENVVVLTDENFAELVLASDDMWMVDAYTAWCPACNKLQPVWDLAATTLLGNVRLGASDCDRNEQLTEDLKVAYFPTIYCFPKGKKSIDTYTIYMGRSSLNHIVPWALYQLRGGKMDSLMNSLDEKKVAVAKTLRKKKKVLTERKGYLVGGYGFVLGKAGEYANQHETSSTKLIYKSQMTQTSRLLKHNKSKTLVLGRMD